MTNAKKIPSLDWYLWQLRRIAEHREKDADAKIRKVYKDVLQDLNDFLAEEYDALLERGDLTYEILQNKGEYARFLLEVNQRLDGLSAQVSKEIRAVVSDVYRLSYTGMVDLVDRAVDNRMLHRFFTGLRNVTPETIRAAVQNPIDKLTLNERLRRKRVDIIQDIKKEIANGLAQGDRMTDMSARITKVLDGDYTKATRVIRTEVHRVREQGNLDAALDTNEYLSSAGFVFTKTWMTMDDERVRPNRGIGKKPVKSPKANHVKMHGKTVPIDEEFDLGRGVKAMAPGQSGDAANDINCRCYLSYDIEEKLSSNGPTAA